MQLDRARWRKSRASGGNGACVEVADLAGTVGVRDSKDPAGTVLTFTPAAWSAFTASVRMGALR